MPEKAILRQWCEGQQIQWFTESFKNCPHMKQEPYAYILSQKKNLYSMKISSIIDVEIDINRWFVQLVLTGHWVHS